MKHAVKRVALLMIAMILAACQATGTKSVLEINESVAAATGDSAFFFRDTGFAGSAVTFSVKVDGEPVGFMAVNQSLEIKLPRRTSEIEVNITGPGAISTIPGKVTVVNDGKVPNYFIVGLKSGLFAGSVTVVETTQGSYLQLVQ